MQVLAFRDINPVAPVHFLVIPKDRKGLSMLEKADEHHEALLGHMMVVVAKVARQEKLAEGYRVVINNGKQGCKNKGLILSGQAVYHIHIHVIGGKQLSWPPGVE